MFIYSNNEIASGSTRNIPATVQSVYCIMGNGLHRAIAADITDNGITLRVD